jgi:hypothetical protein
LRVADGERARLEIAFDGGQTIGLIAAAGAAEELDRALADGGDGAVTIDAEDGRYTLPLRRIVYVKRVAREARVGFGT